MNSTAKASQKRGQPGWPKGANKLWDDIFEITGGKGIKPETRGPGGPVTQEYSQNVPRFMQNSKSPYGFDQVQDALGAKGWDTTKDDIYSLLKQAEKDATFGGPREEGGFAEPDPEELQAQLEEMKKEYAPLMKKGEDLQDFLSRMGREAAEDGFGTEPRDVDEYIREMLKKVPEGGGTPGEPPPTPFLVSVKKARSEGLWWAGRKMADGSPVVALDPYVPASAIGAGPDIYSDALRHTFKFENVIAMEGWKNTLKRYDGRIEDPKLEEFKRTIREIYEETNHYWMGDRPNVAYTPPFIWKAQIRDGYSGSRGGRVFQLKYLMGADATARMVSSAIRANFSAMSPLYYGEAVVHGSRGTVGALYNPGSGIIMLNPFWIAEEAFRSPWGMAAYLRDVVTHELTHFWEPVHNEAFTSRLMDNNARMAKAWPYIVRIAEKLLDQPAVIDKRKSFIALGPGPGQGQKVSNMVIRTAGEETAKTIAQAKENKGARSLYVARKPGSEAAIRALAQRFGNRLVTSQAVRAQHGNTTTWIANEPPDAVVFPQSTEDVQEIVRICAAHRVPVIPFGTGTSLEGHVNAPLAAYRSTSAT